MTETEWLASKDPATMLSWLTSEGIKRVPPQLTKDGRLVSDRKLRLFACACSRLHADTADFSATPAHPARLREACSQAEDAVDGLRPLPRPGEPKWSAWMVWDVDASRATELVTGGRTAMLGPSYAALIRDIVGNPFRPPNLCGGSLSPGLDWEGCMFCLRRWNEWNRWRDGTVPKLASGIYERRSFDWLPVLADALDDAGCTEPAILEHLRGPGPHVRGCWVLDLLLGKE